jgi:hypothetical protein
MRGGSYMMSITSHQKDGLAYVHRDRGPDPKMDQKEL